MNVETGEILRGLENITAAQQRGEPVVSVSAQVADMMQIAQEQIALQAIELGKQHPEMSQAECIALARKTLAAKATV